MPGRYEWDAVHGFFIDKNGKVPVSRDAIRGALDKTIRTAGDRASLLADQLRSGSISLDTWRTEMRDLIKNTHSYSAAAAKGGWAQMTPADYGRVGQILSRGPKNGFGEYEYLEKFADDVATGKTPLDGRVSQRARMYTEAARKTYHTFDGRSFNERGFDEERSVRHVADSCDGCIAAEALGWQQIGTLPPVGTRTCLRNCKCTMDYRKSNADLEDSSARVLRLAEELRTGKINLAEWQREMKTIINAAELVA